MERNGAFKLIICALCISLWMPSAGFAQNAPILPAGPSPPAKRPPPSPPPFPAARGGGGPLEISIDGLSEGISRVAAGQRRFSLCLQGGEPPYEVGVQQAGNTFVDLKDLGSREISDPAGALDFDPGRYDVRVGDGGGAQANGQFTVVPSSQIPGGPPATNHGDALAQAGALLGSGAAFTYEAYLRLMSSNSKDAETERMLDGICRRTAPEAYPAGPALEFGGAELVLSSELNVVDQSDPNSPSARLAYLTQAQTFYTEFLYAYDSYSASGYDPRTLTRTASRTDHQQTTALVAYGVTDDLTIGADVPWSWASERQSTMRPNFDSNVTIEKSLSTDDPSFFAAYRVLKQSEGPATLFLQSSYSPAVFDDERSAFGVGAAFVRWESQFAIAGVVDAHRVGELTTVAPAVTTTQDAYWREIVDVTGFVPINQRWAAALSVSDTLPNDRTSSNPARVSTIDFPDTVSVSPSITFAVVPQQVFVIVSYSHGFSYSYENNGSISRPGGSNVFGIVLSNTGLLDQLRGAVE